MLLYYVYTVQLSINIPTENTCPQNTLSLYITTQFVFQILNFEMSVFFQSERNDRSVILSANMIIFLSI